MASPQANKLGYVKKGISLCCNVTKRLSASEEIPEAYIFLGLLRQVAKSPGLSKVHHEPPTYKHYNFMITIQHEIYTTK